MPWLYLPKSKSHVHFVHPLEDAKQYSNPIASLTLSAASAKTMSHEDSSYIADSDPEEDKEDPEEDPADHPADG
ncbi:hypothetical protein Tco_0874293 [Tanacetum coccineum]|uniref:Uncharacterized protein n=1 Tax=Tanacetum coccineum TaxID=301880 RepID=A0ABQ5BP15_9ASTR